MGHQRRHTVTLPISVASLSGVFFAPFPLGIPGGGTHIGGNAGASGAVTGVTARVATGGDITLGATTVSIYRDVDTYPNGETTDPSTNLAIATARDERKVYLSASKTPTPSDTTADWDDTFDPSPFNNGFYVTVDTSGGSGVGTTDVLVEIDMLLFD